MSEFKHTLGPWKWAGCDFGFINSKNKLVRWSWTEHCLGPDDETWAEIEANRRLIAAAPSMYEALRNIADSGIDGNWQSRIAAQVLREIEEE